MVTTYVCMYVYKVCIDGQDVTARLPLFFSRSRIGSSVFHRNVAGGGRIGSRVVVGSLGGTTTAWMNPTDSSSMMVSWVVLHKVGV
jgi:hypothetical protein